MTKNNGGIKKGDLQCRSCKKTFNHEDLIVKKTERFGLILEEKVCPHCGSRTYGYIDYPVNEEDLLYKDFIHRNCDRKLTKILDEITNEIMEEDMRQYNEKNFIKEVNNERMAMA